MPIETPRTWAVAQTLTSGDMNRFVRDIQQSLAGSSGPVELQNGVRPGALTEAQLAARTNVPAGTLFYDQTTQRIVYHDGSIAQPTGFTAHDSGLLSLFDLINPGGGATTSRKTRTIAHTLGRPPVFFQIVWEFVRPYNPSSTGSVPPYDFGWSVGEQWYPMRLGQYFEVLASFGSGPLRRETIWDATATEYTINIPRIYTDIPHRGGESGPFRAVADNGLVADGQSMSPWPYTSTSNRAFGWAVRVLAFA